MIPFILSYCFWLFLLIRLTTLGSLKWRFWIKILTSAHFVGLGAWAIFKYEIHDHELLIMMGLISSFIGDLALGQKHKSKWLLVMGIGFFMLTMLCYSAFFKISEVSIWLSIPVFLGLSMIFINISQSKFYDFKRLGIIVLLYGILLAIMAVTALAKGILEPSNASLARTIGALFLLFSDFTLMHVYFYTPKIPNHVTLYLVLYHAGQGLIAASLWLR